MDEIGAKAQAARLEVLRHFPEPSTLTRRRELTSLAETYLLAARRAETFRFLAEQLRLVKTHVKWACDIFPLIFQLKNLDLADNYRTNVRPLESFAGHDGANLSRQSSTLSLTTTSHSSRDSRQSRPRRLPPRITDARLRELRRIWRDGVVPVDVPDLVPLRLVRTLAELKVPYAVHLANVDGRAVRIP